MKRAVAFSLFLVLYISSNVTALDVEHIIGGQVAKKDQFIYQVSLQLGRIHICGGALIAANLVLTASHCFVVNSKFIDKPLMVVAETTNTKENKIRNPVTKIYSHKDYRVEKNNIPVNDIAVLRLEKYFVIDGRSIGLASLPNKGEDFNGQLATVSGYGWDSIKVIGKNKEVGSSSGILKYGSVRIMTCQKHENPTRLCGQISQTSQTSHDGVCTGDSGGPLVIGSPNDAKVIGIVSTSFTGCDESKTSAIYTKVSEFASFIGNAINDRPGQDTLVKTINYKIYEIPNVPLNVITTSPKHQAMLDQFEKDNMKFQTIMAELEQLSREQDMLKALAAKDKTKVAALQAKTTEYQNKSKMLVMLQGTISEAKKMIDMAKQSLQIFDL